MVLRDIFRRKGTSLMVVAAVVVASSLLIAMLSMAGGLLTAVNDVLNTEKQDLVVTADGSRSIRGGHALGSEIEAMDGINVAAPVLYSFFGQIRVHLVQSNDTISPLIQGMEPSHLEMFLPGGDADVEGGFSEGEDKHYANGDYTGPWLREALINRGTADKFGVRIGDEAVFENGELNVSYTITGIVDIGLTGRGILGGVYIMAIPLSELQSLLGLDVDSDSKETLDVIDHAVINLDQDVRTDADATAKVVEELDAKYPLYYVLTRAGMQEELEEELGMSRGFYLALGGVSVAIGMLFVVTIMLMTVFERTREIGVMRAIGSSRGSIFSSIFTESLLLVVLGTVVSVVPGYYGSLALEGIVVDSLGISVSLLSFNLKNIGMAIALVVLAGSLASTYPAWVATRLDIVEALKQVK